MINREHFIAAIEEQIAKYWNEPFGGIYTAEEAIEFIKLFPEVEG